MNIAFAKHTKLHNIVGRSEYINDPSRQEHILFTEQHQKYPWQIHQVFEKLDKRDGLNEGREVVFTFPAELRNDTKKLKEICDRVGTQLFGKDIDYEYACHIRNEPKNGKWNLNVHFIHSERHNLDTTTLTPKIYKKDIWQDDKTHRLTKANTPGASLVHKKGEIQRDKDGNIKYNEDIFSNKDRRFASMEFYKHECVEVFSKVLNEYGFNYEAYDFHKHGKSMPKYNRGDTEERIAEVEKQRQVIRQQREKAITKPKPTIIPKAEYSHDKVQSQLLNAWKKQVDQSRAVEVKKQPEPIVAPPKPTTEPIHKSVQKNTEPHSEVQKQVFTSVFEKGNFERDWFPVNEKLDMYFKDKQSVNYHNKKYRDENLIPDLNEFLEKWKSKFEQLVSATYKNIRSIVSSILKNTPVQGQENGVQALKRTEKEVSQQVHEFTGEDIKNKS